jgi:hypothetical protein
MLDETNPKKSARGSNSKTEMSVFEGCLKGNMLDAAVGEMRRLKSRNGGRLPHGSMEKILNELRKNALLADATRDTIRNHMVKLQKKNAPPISDDDSSSDNSGDIIYTFPTDDEGGRPKSPPTPDDDSLVITLPPPTKKRGRPKASTEASPAVDSLVATVPPPTKKVARPKLPKASPAAAMPVATLPTIPPPRNKGGRPKGSTKALSLLRPQKEPRPQSSTKALSRRQREARDAALEWASTQLMEKQQEVSTLYKRHLKRGTLKALIDEANKKFQLEGDNLIDKDTVRTRAKRGNPSGRMRSPMHDVEPCLIAWCKQRYRMGEVFDAKAFLAQAHSIIAGTPMETKVLQSKKYGKNGDGSLLTTSYFVKFMKRHGDSLTSYNKLSNMYDYIYECMQTTGIARKLDTPLLMNRQREIVTSDPFGEPVEHELIYPDRLLFLDATGYSTSKTDGQVAGNTYIGDIGGSVNITAATYDVNFTVLPMSNGVGQPVLCILVFQTDKTAVQAKWSTGIDSMVPIADYTADDVAFLRNNSGPGKMFPSGPVCNVAGKSIPCYVTASPSGVITSQMLADVLKYLDDFDVFPRATGPRPFVVLDGYTSVLGEPLRKYINYPDHKWTVCVGNPDTTDEYVPEMNGSFKAAMATAKEELVRHKLEHHEAVRVCATDVVPLVNKAWASSFGDAEKGLNALAGRGWNPLNRALLTPEHVLKPPFEDLAEDHGVGNFL